MSVNNGTNRGKTALVTGASSGIGYDLAQVFAGEGFNLVLVARSRETLEKMAEEFRRKYKIEARVIAKDLSKPEAPQEIYDELQHAGVQVDVLINNAGYATYGHFFELDLQGELDMLQVNVMTLTHLTRLFLPGMVARRYGKIMNLASTAAFQPGPLMAVYYASKAYVLSFSEALANELEGTGVTVTALCPGPTASGFQKRANMEESKLIKSFRLMDSATVARAGYAALMKGKTVEVPGTVNAVGSYLPRLVPRKLATRMIRNMQERAAH